MQSVRIMEAELSVLKEEQPDLVEWLLHESGTDQYYIHCDHDQLFIQSNEELRRRLAAVDCQMRKEKKAVRRYEVATEKLLQFVEVFHYQDVS